MIMIELIERLMLWFFSGMFTAVLLHLSGLEHYSLHWWELCISVNGLIIWFYNKKK